MSRKNSDGEKLKELYLTPTGTQRKGRDEYVCLLCNPEYDEASDVDVKTLLEGASGYTWVMQHFKAHPQALDEGVVDDQQLLLSSNAINTFEWLDWIVTENRELDFVNKQLVRKHTNNKIIRN